MNHVTAKLLTAYFDNPPLTDYLSIPTGDHPGVLGCSVEQSPAWPAMQAIGLMLAEQAKADRARRAAVSRQRDDDAIGFTDSYVEPTVRVPRVLVGSTLPPMARQVDPVPVRPSPERPKPAPRVATRSRAADRKTSGA